MKSALLLATIAFSLSAFTDDDVPAYRPLDVDYTVFEQNVMKDDKDQKMLKTTPLGSAQPFSEKSTLPKAPAWRSKEDLQKRFEELRDNRFLNDGKIKRRIPWLYPKDGCYARAALANRDSFQKFIPIPKKIFAFGNLRVKTPNAKAGVVGWWYHVAPIVEVNGQKYVLDPAIEPKRPLQLQDWLGRMGNPNKMKISICNTGTYTPGSNCFAETDGMELRAERSIERFLDLEKENLKSLKRRPEAELVDLPPWKDDE